MAESSEHSIAEEIQVIEAVFCQEDEFLLHGLNDETGTANFTINAQCARKPSSETDQQLENTCNHGNSESLLPHFVMVMRFNVGPGYPSTVPDISLSATALARKPTEHLRKDLIEYVNEHLMGQPMVLQIVEWVQEHAAEYANEDKTLNQSQQTIKHKGLDLQLFINTTVMLLRLDHMRAKTKYVRTLLSWTAELGIVGRLFFVDKLILILLEGFQENIKEFILRLKTQKVDVDSSGKSCKEKMMSVLCERPANHITRFASFEACEMENTRELMAAFVTANLTDIYDLYIQPLFASCMHGAGR